MKKTFLISIFLFWAGVAVASGTTIGNGGQQVAAEFSASALQAVNFISAHQSLCSQAQYAGLCGVDLSNVNKAISKVTLEVYPGLTSTDPGTGVIMYYSALNFPDRNLIQISQSDWVSSGMCGLKKMTLAFHEYLGIIAVEQNNYSISSLLRLMLINYGDPNLFIGCEQDIPTNCDDKISGVISNLEHNCFNNYLQSSRSISDRDALMVCAMNNANSWKYGFGKTCGGQKAQDRCYSQCIADGVGDPCTSICPQF